MVDKWVKDLAALGDAGEYGQVAAPILGAFSAGQGLYSALTAGPNKRDGLVADAASSVGMAVVSTGLSAAPKVAQYFASEAAKTSAANLDDFMAFDRAYDAKERAGYLKERPPSLQPRSSMWL